MNLNRITSFYTSLFSIHLAQPRAPVSVREGEGSRFWPHLYQHQDSWSPSDFWKFLIHNSWLWIFVSIQVNTPMWCRIRLQASTRPQSSD